jgi:hypothetical protein
MARMSAMPRNFLYARDREDRPWHMSRSKNIAHRLGSGDVLVNLDCDNFLGNTIEVVREPLERGVKAIHLWSGTKGDGTCGRIAVTREVFHSLGGYDESFQPVGHDDLDLLKRIKHAGHAVEYIPCPPNSAIINTREEALRYCAPTGLTWMESTMQNRRQSDQNVANGRLVANEGKKWGAAEIELFRAPSSSNATCARKES